MKPAETHRILRCHAQNCRGSPAETSSAPNNRGNNPFTQLLHLQPTPPWAHLFITPPTLICSLQSPLSLLALNQCFALGHSPSQAHSFYWPLIHCLKLRQFLHFEFWLFPEPLPAQCLPPVLYAQVLTSKLMIKIMPRRDTRTEALMAMLKMPFQWTLQKVEIRTSAPSGEVIGSALKPRYFQF